MGVEENFFNNYERVEKQAEKAKSMLEEGLEKYHEGNLSDAIERSKKSVWYYEEAFEKATECKILEDGLDFIRDEYITALFTLAKMYVHTDEADEAAPHLEQAIYLGRTASGANKEKNYISYMHPDHGIHLTLGAFMHAHEGHDARYELMRKRARKTLGTAETENLLEKITREHALQYFKFHIKENSNSYLDPKQATNYILFPDRAAQGTSIMTKEDREFLYPTGTNAMNQ